MSNDFISILSNAIEKKPADFNEKVSDILTNKTVEKLEAFKTHVAKNMFNTTDSMYETYQHEDSVEEEDIEEMLKTIDTSSDLYGMQGKDGKKFIKKHTVNVIDDANGNDDEVFKAKNIKKYDRSKTRHGYDTGQDEKVYEDEASEQQVEESLSPQASAKEYIDDFVRSNKAQFKDKPKSKRIKMALAAYYANKRKN